MTESLDDFPAVFREQEVMPWDREPGTDGGYVWLWGLDRGKPLIDIDSRELLRKRRWLVAHGGFPSLVKAVDQVLTDRQGL